MVEGLFSSLWRGPQARSTKKGANSLQYGLNKLVHNVLLISLSILCKEKVEAFIYVFYVIIKLL